MVKKEKQKICPICQEKLTFLKSTLKDGIKVCSKHVVQEAGLLLTETIEQSTVEDIKERIEQVKLAQHESELDVANFSVSKKIGNFIAIDEENKKWATLSSIRGKIQQIFDYDDIVDFELLEDGNSVASGGLGRALAGGVLFGGAGAIVGGVTGKKKNKEFCRSLRMKVTVNDIQNPAVYINFIETKTKKDGFVYKTIAQQAQECLSLLQLICDRQDKESAEDSKTSNPADEIMKFKQLLDAGAITYDEYEAKKKQLLGL